MNLEQLRKQAKELAGAARTGDPEALARIGDLPVKLASAQTVLAREQGFASWPALVHELAEQPFRTDLEYYEGRAEGIATVDGVPLASARRDLAQRHGYSSWAGLTRHVTALASGEEPATPFMLAYRAVEDGERDRLAELLDEHPELVRTRGTNGNDLLGMAGDLESVKLLLERGADVNRGNDYGWTKLHQAGYSNDRTLATLVLAAGARTDLSARGDGGTPLVAALFWGHREVVDLLGLEPRNLRVAVGPRPGRPDRRAGGDAGRRCASGVLPSSRRLSGLAAVRRPAGDPGRGARLGGQGRPGRGDRSARRARLGRRGGSLSRHTARMGCCERAGSDDPPPGRARCRPERPGHVRRPDARRGRTAAPPGRAVRAGGRGRPPARARGRPDHPRPALRRQCRGLGGARLPPRSRGPAGMTAP